MKKNLVCWDAFDTSWEKELTKGATLDIPLTNHVTATEVVIGTKGSALDPFATAGKQLTIAYYYEAPVDIGYMTKRQTQADMESTAVNEASYAISVTMDTSVATLFSSLGGYSTSAYGTDGQTLSDDILLYLKETLDEADVPMDSDRSLIIDPSGLVDLLKIDKFVAAEYGKMADVSNGKVGRSPIYGCMVRVTNNLVAATTGSYGVMAHKKAIMGAAQIEKSWRKEFEELHETRYQSEALWGVAEARDNFGIPFYTRKA
jgi:hypothetical protein